MSRLPLPHLLVFALLSGCAPSEEAPAPPAARDGAPSLEELREATFIGIGGVADTVALRGGVWEGAPLVEGGESRPSVLLVPEFRLVGDWDGDGAEDAAVLLSESSGGSGEFLYLVTVTRRDGAVRQVAIAPLGDRVQVRDARSDSELLVLDVVQAGGADPMCCPGDLATRKWRYGAGGFEEVPAQITGRLTPETLGGSEWVLTHWDLAEPKTEAVPVTLRYEAGQLSGSSGCNRYTAAVRRGELPGDILLGPMAGTLRACPEPEMAVEDRYRALLGAVRKFEFEGGRLALVYERNETYGTLLFRRGESAAP